MGVLHRYLGERMGIDSALTVVSTEKKSEIQIKNEGDVCAGQTESKPSVL